MAVCDRVVGACWQQPRAEQQEGQRARRYGDEPHAGDLEDAEPWLAVSLRDAVHQQVGRRSDQRQRATQDGHVGQKYQQPRSRNAHRAREAPDQRDQHNNDRCVVDERGCNASAGKHLRDCEPRRTLRSPDDAATKRFDGPGPDQSTRENKKGGDRDRRRVGEGSGDQVGCSPPQHDHDTGSENSDGHWWKSLGRESHEQCYDKDKAEQRLVFGECRDDFRPLRWLDLEGSSARYVGPAWSLTPCGLAGSGSLRPGGPPRPPLGV